MHQDGVKFGETTIYGGLSKEKMRAEGLFEKAYQGKMSDMNAALKKGELPKKDKYQRSLLHWAAAGGHEHICRFLVQNGVQLNNPDVFGETPLHLAIEFGHERLAMTLLGSGADPNWEPFLASYKTPMWMAEQKSKRFYLDFKNAYQKARNNTAQALGAPGPSSGGSQSASDALAEQVARGGGPQIVGSSGPTSPTAAKPRAAPERKKEEWELRSSEAGRAAADFLTKAGVSAKTGNQYEAYVPSKTGGINFRASTAVPMTSAIEAEASALIAALEADIWGGSAVDLSPFLTGEGGQPEQAPIINWDELASTIFRNVITTAGKSLVHKANIRDAKNAEEELVMIVGQELETKIDDYATTFDTRAQQDLVADTMECLVERVRAFEDGIRTCQLQQHLGERVLVMPRMILVGGLFSFYRVSHEIPQEQWELLSNETTNSVKASVTVQGADPGRNFAHSVLNSLCFTRAGLIQMYVRRHTNACKQLMDAIFLFDRVLKSLVMTKQNPAAEQANVSTFIKALAEQLKKILTVVEAVRPQTITAEATVEELNEIYDTLTKSFKATIDIARSNNSPLFMPAQTAAMADACQQIMMMTMRVKMMTVKDKWPLDSRDDIAPALEALTSLFDKVTAVIEVAQSVVGRQRDPLTRQLLQETIDTTRAILVITKIAGCCLGAQNKIMARIHLPLILRTLTYPLSILLDPLYHNL